jgi:hypothetical protein
MTIFKVANEQFCFMVEGESTRAASAYIRRRRGADEGPCRAKRATPAEVRDHLAAGAMVLRATGGIMPREDAHAFAASST